MFEKTKSVWKAGKRVQAEVNNLQANLKKLAASQDNLTAFQHDVQRAVDRWQFEAQPRLDKINELLKHLNQ